MATMSYEQMLRTLGGYFRHAGTDQAVLMVSPEGVEVADIGGAYNQRWDVAALQAEARQQRGLCGLLRETFQNPWQVTRALRLVGADLDERGAVRIRRRCWRTASACAAPTGTSGCTGGRRSSSARSRGCRCGATGSRGGVPER